MLHNRELVSIIVPVFNVEKFLSRCIDSLLNQNYKSIEIILVNDGSTDSSLRICKDYQKKDSRIRIIDQDNQGLSMARNAGVKVARGVYICFVDSDDWVENDYVSFGMNLIRNNSCDMACFGYYLSDGIYKKAMPRLKRGNISGVCNRIEGQKLLARDVIIASHAWDKIYKKCLFDDIKFPQGKVYEDVFIMHEIMNRCNTIAYSLEPKYYYFERDNSIARSYKNKNILDFFEAELDRYHFFLKYCDEAVGIQTAKMMELVLSYYPRFDFKKKSFEIDKFNVMISEIEKAYKLKHNKFKQAKFNILYMIYNFNKKLYRRVMTRLI